MAVAGLSPNMRRAARVKLLCLDVDGTLTDGALVSAPGGWIRRYSALDGLGVRQFIDGGGVAAIVSAAREGQAGIRERAAQMGILHVYFGVDGKLGVVKTILAAEGLAAEAAAFVGDDAPDVEAMRYVGFACAPRGAHASALAAAHYIPRARAGAGAIREICDYIIAARHAATS